MEAIKVIHKYQASLLIAGNTLTIIISFLAYGQTGSQPTPMPANPSDLSHLSYQALAEQKDAAKQDVNELNGQIGWTQSLINVVAQLKQVQSDKTAKPEDVDALRKQVRE